MQNGVDGERLSTYVCLGVKGVKGVKEVIAPYGR